MYNLFFYLVLFLFSAYVLISTIAYAKYEITTNKNKIGAIALISFSIISIILSNFFVLLNQ